MQVIFSGGKKCSVFLFHERLCTPWQHSRAAFFYSLFSSSAVSKQHNQILSFLVLLHVSNFSSQTVVSLWLNQKQREAVSRDMIKPRKQPTHPFLQWSYNPSFQRTAHNQKQQCECGRFQEKLSSHFLLLLLILSMCLSFYCNLQYA